MACLGTTIYIQHYGSDTKALEQWKQLNAATLQLATVPPAENVWASATRRGRPVPKPVPGTTAIYHTTAELDCAQSLAGVTVKAFAAALRGTPGVVEDWIAPAQPAAQ